MVTEVCYSDGGSDSSVSDGPPVHMMSLEMKSSRKKVTVTFSRVKGYSEYTELMYSKC